MIQPKESKKGISKNEFRRGMKVGKPITKEELDRKMYEHSYKAQNRNTGAIKMTAAPHEYFLGGGVAKGGFNLAKSLVQKVVTKAKPFIRNAAVDLGIDQAL